jgi:hypothetical protein
MVPPFLVVTRADLSWIDTNLDDGGPEGCREMPVHR